MKINWDKHIGTLLIWVTRRSPATKVWKSGLACLTLLIAVTSSDLGTWLLITVFNTVTETHATEAVAIDALFGPWPRVAYWCMLLFSSAMTAGGLWWEYQNWENEQSKKDKKVVLAIELRGLRDFKGSSIADAVPETLVGRREPLLYDVRQALDGTLFDPHRAMEKISGLATDLQRWEVSHDRGDVSIVVGGLAPVPLTFLAGLLLDDEANVMIVDWHRTTGEWQPITSMPDWKRLEVQIPETCAEEVVVATSISYHANMQAITTEFESMPMVQIAHPDPNSSEHWSSDAQNSWSMTFFETLKKLEAKQVKKIHLVLAAPSSVVLNLARRYDKRNLPDIIVYQYEGSEKIKYPWGVAMPVRGKFKPTIVRRDVPEEPRLVSSPI